MRWSDSVVLPWSTWARTHTLRMRPCSTRKAAQHFVPLCALQDAAAADATADATADADDGDGHRQRQSAHRVLLQLGNKAHVDVHDFICCKQPC